MRSFLAERISAAVVRGDAPLEWWRLHHWVLRALLAVGIVLLTYVGFLGIAAASSVSEDGAEIAMVIGGIFLFLAAIMFWWLCVDLRRD